MLEALNGSSGTLPSQVNPTVIEAMTARAAIAPPGPFIEVGVFQGGTAWHLSRLAAAQDRELWLYDTFTGTPHEGPHDSHKVGDFSACSVEDIRAALPHAHVIQGVFPQSARGVEFFPQEAVAFAHLDCDQEQSYRDALAFIVPRMARRGILWFDDAPCLPGACRAVESVFPLSQLELTEGKWWVRL